MNFVRRQAWLTECALPLIALTGLALYAAQAGADEAVARAIWTAGGGSWQWGDAAWAQALYRLGPWPAIALGIGALVGLGLSFLGSPWRAWRTPALFVVLLVGLGPGLLINGLLKPGWGRPRPRQLVEFGGEAHYLAPWQTGPHGAGQATGRSFPSGHASMGFALMAPYFLWARRRRGARAGLGLGLVAGLLIGAARVCQGGHFVTDVLFAGIIVYATGWGLARVLLWQRVEAPRAQLVRRRWGPEATLPQVG